MPRPKCQHCGSRELIHQPYSVYCSRCGLDTIVIRHNKVEQPSTTPLLDANTRAAMWYLRNRTAIIFFYVLLIVAVFILTRMTS